MLTRFTKPEVIQWGDFFAPKSPETGVMVYTFPAMAASSLLALMNPQIAAAKTLTERIMGAFAPLIEVASAVSYPVCYIMIIGGFVLIATGNPRKGMRALKWAAIGYVGIQLAPGIMDILNEIGKAIRR